MSPRRAVKQELTREMIMNVARNLFVQQGYQHTSMRKIATELGIAMVQFITILKIKLNFFMRW